MELIGEVVFPIFIFVVMVIGLLGLVVPIFPGGVVIWIAALLYGLVSGFGTLGGWMFGVVTLFMILSVLADNFLMGAKALEAGASWWGIIIGLLSGIIASIFLTPLGGLVVAPLALYLVEYMRIKDSEQALNITKGLMLGCGWAFVARFGFGIVQIGSWAVWAINSL